MTDDELLEETEDEKMFRRAVRDIFSGENGKAVLEFLALAHVYPTALRQTPELTAYALGQKEFVQRLIDFAKYDKDLNKYTE